MAALREQRQGTAPGHFGSVGGLRNAPHPEATIPPTHCRSVGRVTCRPPLDVPHRRRRIPPKPTRQRLGSLLMESASEQRWFVSGFSSGRHGPGRQVSSLQGQMVILRSNWCIHPSTRQSTTKPSTPLSATRAALAGATKACGRSEELPACRAKVRSQRSAGAWLLFLSVSVFVCILWLFLLALARRPRLSLFRRPSVAAGALNATRGAAPWLRDRAVASG